MKVLITGGGGFLGFKLAKALLARGNLGGKPITSLTLLDGAFPAAAAKEPRLKAVTGDVSDAKTLAQVCPPDTDAVFHLAAVVSGAAEADFDLGMRVNLDGTRRLRLISDDLQQGVELTALEQLLDSHANSLDVRQ